MSGFELVAGIIVAFFVIGIGVGVTMMIALTGIRYRRSLHGDDWHGGRYRSLRWRDEGTGRWDEPGPGPHDDPDDRPGDDPRRWPGS